MDDDGHLGKTILYRWKNNDIEIHDSSMKCICQKKKNHQTANYVLEAEISSVAYMSKFT